jgi:hypothetical protein
LLTITYHLAGQAEVNKQAFISPGGMPAPLWECEEIEVIGEGDQRFFVHAILFTNGWSLHIPFRDVQMQEAEPVFAYRVAPADSPPRCSAAEAPAP